MNLTVAEANDLPPADRSDRSDPFGWAWAGPGLSRTSAGPGLDQGWSCIAVPVGGVRWQKTFDLPASALAR
jgi:hypothetical protein